MSGGKCVVFPKRHYMNHVKVNCDDVVYFFPIQHTEIHVDLYIETTVEQYYKAQCILIHNCIISFVPKKHSTELS